MDSQSSSNYYAQFDDFTNRERHAHRHDMIERAIEISGGFLTTLLLFRFVLALLAANPTNGFASFIYGFTNPFTAPFYSLFSYDHPTLGVSTFEGYTLVAIAVYGLLAVGLAKLVTITRY